MDSSARLADAGRLGKVRYDYNARGQPVRRWRGDINSMAIDRYWLWDGDQLLLELDRDGNRLAEYLYHPGTADQPYALVHGATSPAGVRYFQQDELGNVLGLSDGTSISQSLSYDAWGTPTVSGSGQGNLYWKGLLWDGDVVQLYYMRNRWYDPELGRFVSEDPIGHSGGINLYVFAGNDPVNASDPDGLGCKVSTKRVCQLPTAVVTAPRSRPAPPAPIGSWNFDRSRGWDWDCYGGRETGPACRGLSGSDAEEAMLQIGRRLRPVNAALQCVDASLFLAGNVAVDFVSGRALARLGVAGVALHNASAAEYSAWLRAAGRPIAPRIAAAQDVTATAGVSRAATRGAGSAAAVSMAQGAGRGTIMNGGAPGLTDVFFGGTVAAYNDFGRRCN